MGVQKREMFVDGEWVPAAGGETQDILNPATGGVIATVPKGSEEDVDRAVKAARRAFEETWFDATPGERARMLLETSDLRLEQVARSCGFGTVETLRRVFGRRLGVSPNDYRVRFATADVIPIARRSSRT